MTKKNPSISHRALDRLIEFQTKVTTDIGQFKVDVIKGFNTLKDTVREAIEKHNDLAASVSALEAIVRNVAGFAASKAGHADGNLEARFISIARGIRGQDLNILAMGEVLKEVVGQLTQTDAIFRKLMTNRDHFLDGNLVQNETFAKCFELSAEEVEMVKKDAESWYTDLVRSAFKTAQEKVREQEREADAAYEAEQQRAKEAAEQAAAEQAKTQAIKDELEKATQDERSISASTSGGPGADFPKGAEIFGG